MAVAMDFDTLMQQAAKQPAPQADPFAGKGGDDLRRALLNHAYRVLDKLGRKPTPDDVWHIPHLHRCATEYVKAYVGDFAFMLSLQQQLRERGALSDKQLVAALNILKADGDTRKRQKAEAQEIIQMRNVGDATIAAAMMKPKYADVWDGIYDVELSNNRGHVTLRIRTQEKGNLKGKRIVSYLNGPDNTADYIGFAFYDGPTGYKVWQRYQSADRVLDALHTLLTMTDAQWQACRANNCGRCGRLLTVPASRYRGFGPTCAEIMGIA